MKKKILILATILTLSLTACNNNKVSNTTNTNSPVVETEINNESTDNVEETKETDVTVEKEEFNADEVISDMKKEFISEESYAEIRDYDIVIENNKIRIEAVVEEGISEDTAKEIGVKSMEKLDELLKNKGKSSNDFNISIEIIEDSTNNILYCK